MDIIYELDGQEFEWNEEKALSNERKHGVSFEEAAQVFFDPLADLADASRGNEERTVIIGHSYRLRLLLVVHIVRGPRLRLIPARTATSAEQEDHEKPSKGK